MAEIPAGDDIRDYIAALFKVWEKTPSSQTALFNNKKVAGQLSWAPAKVEAVSLYCSSIGWIRYQPEGSKDYILTEVGVSSARATRMNSARR